MPRTARSTRNSTAPSHKASSTTLKSRASNLTSDISIPPDPPPNVVRNKLVPIFRDAQKTTASHRKLVVTLRKLHERCVYEPPPSDFSPECFDAEFLRCMLRAMPVKRSESAGDNALRFVGAYLKHASEKDAQDGGDDQDDTPTTRLTAALIQTTLPLFTAKDKFVRFRATQLIALVINALDAIDDALFRQLRHALLKRIHDKETMVRSQAVLALGRLAGNAPQENTQDSDQSQNSDSGDDAAATTGLLDKLLDVLQNDPSADVRRSLLLNLPIVPGTLPYLLERARDSDALTRRAVYSRLLPALGDFRHLSLSMREKLLRWGLRDRDESVRKAAGRLFRERWIGDCVGTADPNQQQEGDEGENNKDNQVNFDGLLELLERIDVVNSGVDNGVALEAMKGFWEGRPDYRDAVTFDDRFWETLSAESVLMARSFNDFCRFELNAKYEHLVDEKLPEVTKLAFFLERYLNVLIEAIRRVNAQQTNNEDEQDEEDTVEQEFIVEQLLHIVGSLDYSDEVGRRKMFALLRQTLSVPDLPDEVTKLTIAALRDLCSPDSAGEKEFCSVVLEAVADVHDTIVDDDTPQPGDDADDNESFHSARSEVSGASTPVSANRKRARDKKKDADDNDDGEEDDSFAQAKAIKAILINMKCLHMVHSMLLSVSLPLSQNDHLVSMLNNLVVPAVRSHEAPVRERGLLCLGLCALLDYPLAEENLSLFIHFFTKGHAALQISAIHILTDILCAHGARLLDANPALLKCYLKALKTSSKNPDVQAAAVVAVCKLLLNRVIAHPAAAAEEILRVLLVAYFDPLTKSNHALRQALAYFLPVYCYSRRENQRRVAGVSLEVLQALANLREALEDDDEVDVVEEMAGLGSVGACLVDWTDGRRCVEGGTGGQEGGGDGGAHLELAGGILGRLGGSGGKEEKKRIAPLLAKLHIPPTAPPDSLRALYADVSAAADDSHALLPDATSRNALYKLHVTLGKIVNHLDAAGGGGLGANVGPGGAGARRSVSRRSGSGSASVSVGGAEDRSVSVGMAEAVGDEGGEGEEVKEEEGLEEVEEEGG